MEQMCLVQWAANYTFVAKVSERAEFTDGVCLNIAPLCDRKIFGTDISLPRYVSLEHCGLGFMRLRGFPAVVRFHSSKKKEGHERHYSELLLFCPFRNEDTEFHRSDAAECIKTYEDRKAEIDRNRKEMFPGEAILDLMDESALENQVLQDQRATHIYDTLNAQGEQAQEDDLLEGAIEDPSYQSFGYTGNLNEGPEKADFKYKKIALPDAEEMKFLIQRLVPEQYDIAKRVVQFCKDAIRSGFDKKSKLEPLRIIIHGGSGNIN